MATIQAKTTKGHKYWYIVESRRVNGKPRPIVLAYLGKADDLLKRLQGLTDIKLKSYSHGAVAAMLQVAQQLDVCTIINEHTSSSRAYQSKKPLRNGLTTGATMLLSAIGRACEPTSKRGWETWAKTTSLDYLLRSNFSQLDSQHFWDLMDTIPIEAIEQIESKLLKKAFEIFGLSSDSLFYDTTNFFTYISTTNEDCTLAQRGKNKQKRSDLRQVGLALVVTRDDKIPLFHMTYEGNMNDAKVFKNILLKLKKRMTDLSLPIKDHTLVFDRGNNSKGNMELVEENDFYYVGALTPYHHKELVKEALDYFETNPQEKIYRDKQIIWKRERTLVFYVSDTLKAGCLRGLHLTLEKTENALKKLQETLAKLSKKKYEAKSLEVRIQNILKNQHMRQLFSYTLEEIKEGHYNLRFEILSIKLQEIENRSGLRIIMSNRHDWTPEKIITTYQGQAEIESAFKTIKDPYHLTLKPQFHWTDQKIVVHYFICLLGYLLSSLIYREVKAKTSFKGSLRTLLNSLNDIRLGAVLEDSKTSGPMKAFYKIEEMSKDQIEIMEVLDLVDLHNQRPKLNGFGVYN